MQRCCSAGCKRERSCRSAPFVLRPPSENHVCSSWLQRHSGARRARQEARRAWGAPPPDDASPPTFVHKELGRVEAGPDGRRRVRNVSLRELKGVFLRVPLRPVNGVIVRCREVKDRSRLRTVKAEPRYGTFTFYRRHKLQSPVRVCGEDFVKALQLRVRVVRLKAQ